MKKDLTLFKQQETEKLLQDLKTIVAPNATDTELKLYALYCANTGLNPFMGQIHFIKRKIKTKDGYISKPTFQVSIDGYRAKAEQTNKYAGSDDYLFDEGLTQYEHLQSKRGYPTTATAIVNKIIGKQMFQVKATAQWSAYCPPEGQNFMWKKMPYLMLGKVAEALALRKAFPNVLGGLYIQEEMDTANAEIEPVVVKEEVKEVVKPKEEKIIGTEEVDVFKDFVKRVEASKTKEDVIKTAKEIKIALEGELLSEAEVEKLKSLIIKLDGGTNKPISK